jgi:RimJ/RimL family protein N-acetyltransferase
MDVAALDWASVTLTPVDEGDLAKLNAWQNDPAIRDLTMGYRAPVQREITRQWFENVRTQNLQSRILFAIRRHGDIKGVCQIHSIEWPHRKGIFGLYVGDREDRAAGLGYMASVLMFDYLFRSLDFERVMLEVIAPNGAAKSLYERLGFTREGAFRKAYLLDGERVDIELYGMLKSEWRERAPAHANRLIYTSAA